MATRAWAIGNREKLYLGTPIKISRSRVREADSDTSDDNISLDGLPVTKLPTSTWSAWI